MIKPINGHVLIEPLKQDSFIAPTRETYQEIGTILALSEELTHDYVTTNTGNFKPVLKVGDKVYFDAWLAKKYPRTDIDDFYWLVRYEDLVAYEEQVPEKLV